jgi:hypothetical protein
MSFNVHRASPAAACKEPPAATLQQGAYGRRESAARANASRPLLSSLPSSHPPPSQSSDSPPSKMKVARPPLAWEMEPPPSRRPRTRALGSDALSEPLLLPLLSGSMHVTPVTTPDAEAASEGVREYRLGPEQPPTATKITPMPTAATPAAAARSVHASPATTTPARAGDALFSWASSCAPAPVSPKLGSVSPACEVSFRSVKSSPPPV